MKRWIAAIALCILCICIGCSKNVEISGDEYELQSLVNDYFTDTENSRIADALCVEDGIPQYFISLVAQKSGIERDGRDYDMEEYVAHALVPFAISSWSLKQTDILEDDAYQDYNVELIPIKTMKQVADEMDIPDILSAWRLDHDKEIQQAENVYEGQELEDWYFANYVDVCTAAFQEQLKQTDLTSDVCSVSFIKKDDEWILQNVSIFQEE